MWFAYNELKAHLMTKCPAPANGALNVIKPHGKKFGDIDPFARFNTNAKLGHVDDPAKNP